MSMLMKIATGIVTTALAGGLVYGGIYRTQMKNEQELQRNLGGNGVRESFSVQQSLGGGGQGSAGSGSEGGRGQNAGGSDARIQGSGSGQFAAGSARGQENSGRGAGTAEDAEGLQVDQSQADVHPEDVVIIPAIVQSVSSEAALFQTDDGDTVVVEGRALSFAMELGLSLTDGDQMLLEGFYENGDFEVSSVENLTTGQWIVLREPEGRPLWAGGGRPSRRLIATR